jgi:hypothetical protein
LGLLAVIYNNQVEGCVTARGKENPNFKRIVRCAQHDNKTRFKNKRGGDQLKKREVWPSEVLHPEKVLTAEELQDKRETTVAEMNRGTEGEANMAKKDWLDGIGLKTGGNGTDGGKDGL